ncbi:MAG TPA: c-type cytochrome [Dongiaceae bacterium]|nr:c-type cytochrome [Dongiaceae bacterium]
MRHHLPYFALVCLAAGAIAIASDLTLPDWAYVINPPDAPAPKADSKLHRVPSSSAAFTTAQTQDLFNPPDWHPADHPAMPEIVAHGRKPDVYACSYCHLPNGLGRPENASLAGLPSAYIIRQVSDFRSGMRKSSEPKHLPTVNMITHECKATDQEIAAAADYFSNLPRKPWIRVVETSTVPKTHVAGWMFVADKGSATEPMGQRIIETPEDLERTELRDDASGFIAYVPQGSLKQGKWLVTTGGDGKTVACAKCHGPGLRGSGNVPPISGRSPSYIVRQLFDTKTGARSSAASLQMRRQVMKLNADDMIAIAAFVSSLKP